jgi:hypothetical protein
MKMSENITELSAALVMAQAEIGNAQKNKKNDFLKGAKYADLESVWAAASPALKSHGLSILQLPTQSEKQGHFEMETMLLHKSGQWICSTISLPCPKQDPQGYGSAMTYARRYALAAMLGIVQSDDDGEGAKDENTVMNEAFSEIRKAADYDQLRAEYTRWFRFYENDAVRQKAVIKVYKEAKDRFVKENEDGTAE